MGLLGAAKGEFIQKALETLTHGDKGSTMLGAIATAILLSGVNFGDLFSSDEHKQAVAMGLIAGSLVMAVWGWFIGKKKDVKNTPPPTSPTSPSNK